MTTILVAMLLSALCSAVAFVLGHRAGYNHRQRELETYLESLRNNFKK